ncbi:hypothetical protein [Serratia sp. M24T3]|uniref:hypothetical protein n=1 Tax=Serratia sp. M24T3 TaxID=932213 RepID=UPI00030B3AFE|nr:hypothetical protein [Serratia sp. M24T3]
MALSNVSDWVGAAVLGNQIVATLPLLLQDFNAGHVLGNAVKAHHLLKVFKQ